MDKSDAKKIIFLDRDGVINKKPPKADYVKSVDEFIFLPQALSGLKLLQEKGYEIYIVTNQPGIARGLMTENDLTEIHKYFLDVCKKSGISIKDIYYCPHGWNEGCSCRKPNPGMLFRAAAEHNFDLKNAIFIGDDERDQQAGKAADCRTILIASDGDLFKIVNSL